MIGFFGKSTSVFNSTNPFRSNSAREFAWSSATPLQKLPIPAIYRSFTAEFCPAPIGTKSESVRGMRSPLKCPQQGENKRPMRGNDRRDRVWTDL